MPAFIKNDLRLIVEDFTRITAKDWAAFLLVCALVALSAYVEGM